MQIIYTQFLKKAQFQKKIQNKFGQSAQAIRANYDLNWNWVGSNHTFEFVQHFGTAFEMTCYYSVHHPTVRKVQLEVSMPIKCI